VGKVFGFKFLGAVRDLELQKYRLISPSCQHGFSWHPAADLDSGKPPSSQAETTNNESLAG
jgi:hypothetical protein